jgi:8-oxo-dGTP diphosphatase
MTFKILCQLTGSLYSQFEKENYILDYRQRHLDVTCAIIEQDSLVLVAQRSRTMAMPLKWEFPGGKIKPGETPEHCLRREIVEELAIEVAVHNALAEKTHAYPDFTITLYPFVCTIISGTITLREHAAVTWLPREDLASLDWAAADRPVLETYLQFAGQETP